MKEHAPGLGAQSTGKKRGAARYKQIAEIFKLCFVIRGSAQKQVRDFLEELFDLRDHAVHPRAKWQAPVLRDELGSATDWQYEAFSATNARIAFDKTSKLIGQLLEIPKPKLTKLVEWATAAKALLAEAIRGDAGGKSQ